MDLKSEFGQHIKRIRLTNGLTQERLAELCDCGVPHISHIESGKAFPSCTLLTQLSESLNVKIHELFTFKTKKKITPKKDIDRIKNIYNAMSISKQKLVTEIINKIAKADLS